MMLPLVTFEAEPLRSHPLDLLIEHINFANDGCLLRLLRIVGAYLVQRLLDGEFVYFSHHAMPFQKTKTTSQNLRKNSTLQSGASLLAADDRWISSCPIVFSLRNRLGVVQGPVRWGASRAEAAAPERRQNRMDASRPQNGLHSYQIAARFRA